MKKRIDSELIRKYRKEEVLELARRSQTSLIVHFVIFLFLVIVTPFRTDHLTMAWMFGIIIFIVSSARFVMAKKIANTYDNAPDFWFYIMTLSTLVSGALWGAFGYIIPHFYEFDRTFIYILLINCGLAAGATSSMAPRYSLSRNFTLIMIAPICAFGFLSGSSSGISLAVLCAFSAFMFTRMAKDNYVWHRGWWVWWIQARWITRWNQFSEDFEKTTAVCNHK
ncbi:MAG: hypothetical protein GY729_13205 [Desulfobacteraceae bacterium]|nr:hypothetical protein [Desulfobacteraceae bacterium]